MASYCLRQNLRYLSGEIFSEIFTSYLQSEGLATKAICYESLEEILTILRLAGCEDLVSKNDSKQDEEDFLLHSFARVYLSFSHEDAFYSLGFRGPFLRQMEASVNQIFGDDSLKPDGSSVSFHDPETVDACLGRALNKVKIEVEKEPRYIEMNYLCAHLRSLAVVSKIHTSADLLGQLMALFCDESELRLKKSEFCER